LVGGKLFPGVHHHAHFVVHEHDDHYRIALDSDDHQTHLLVAGQVSAALPDNSIFGSLAEASAFFERGSLGYSVTAKPDEFDGLELRSFSWKVQPLAVERVESSFFEDQALFPAGSVTFDCALLMRGIDHEWHGRESLFAGADAYLIVAQQRGQENVEPKAAADVEARCQQRQDETSPCLPAMCR
jgi:hypothetical protein